MSGTRAEPAEATFADLLSAIGLPSDAPPGETLHRGAVAPSQPPDTTALPDLAIPQSIGRSADRIGEDSVSTTTGASDPTLDRPVALQRVRPDRGARGAAALLAEARMLAALEHPGIPPVHALARDADGLPVVVLKRLAGRAWTEVAAAGPDLDRDLGVALRVAEALAFTHAHGFLHRDVRPDHVILGDFGEVVLTGWGAACPRSVRVTREVVGTPAYLAPEMVHVGAPIGPETDVYLLGASLLRVLTGAAPHAGSTVREALAHAWSAAPLAPGPALPTELAEVLGRACAPDGADRFPTMEAFAEALRGVQVHREAVALAEGADRLRVRLRAAITAGEPTVDRLFAEGQFATRAALEAWPDCPQARAVRVDLFAAYLPHKLAAGDLAAVEALLPELDAEAAAPWTAAIAAARAERARVEAEWWSGNRRFGVRERRRYAVTLSVGAVVVAGVVAAVKPAGEVPVGGLVLLAGLGVVAVLLLTWPYRKDLLGHGISRAIVLGLGWSVSVSFLHRLLGWFAGTPAAVLLRAELLIDAAWVLVLAAMIDLALAFASLPLFVGAWVLHTRPEQATDLFPVFVVTGLSVWAGMFAWRARDGRTAAG